MKKILFFFWLVPCVIFLSMLAMAQEANDDGWVEMPAGARPAYLGIHGGTMPVSLLATDDGAALLTFVGRTGNDFLEVLRQAALPGFSNATQPRGRSLALDRIQTGLFAGNATATLPVIAVSGDVLANQVWFESLEPFGFSEQPLSIEGSVSKPATATVARRFRNFFLPGSLRLKSQ